MEDLIKIVIVVLFFLGPALANIFKKASRASSQDPKAQALQSRIQAAIETAQREAQARRSAQDQAEGGNAPEPRSGSDPRQAVTPQPDTRMHRPAQAQWKRPEPQPLVKPHDHPHRLRPSSRQRPITAAPSMPARTAMSAAHSRQASPSRSRSDLGSRRKSAPEPARVPVEAKIHGFSRKQLRRMIIYKEILGPPRALSGSRLAGPRRF